MPPTQEPNLSESETIIQNMQKIWNSYTRKVQQKEMHHLGRFSYRCSKLGSWLASQKRIWLAESFENLRQKIDQTSRSWNRCQFRWNGIATIVADIATKNVAGAFRRTILYRSGKISKIYGHDQGQGRPDRNLAQLKSPDFWSSPENHDKGCRPWTTSSRKSEFNLESLTLSWSVYWSQKWT